MTMPADLQLEVVHETHYDYSAPVSLAHHLAHLKPLADGQQEPLQFGLQIEPAPDRQNEASDVLGNTCCWFSLSRPHRSLRVRTVSRVALSPRFVALDAAASKPWEEVARPLRYVACAAFDPAVEFTLPSPFVPRLEELRDYGLRSFPPGRPVVQGALELMQRIHADFAYESESTEIDTPLAEAFAHKRGVCQDFAHVMCGTLRMLGLPARYVSGYLLTQAPGHGAAMVGADASHAWVQAYCPTTPGVGADGWLDLDPTNNLVPGAGHVRVAVGRDFGDVTPLRGVIRGGGRHTLAVDVRTRVV